MVLSYDQLGELYLYTCKDNLNINLSKNNYAENLYDTAKYLIDAANDELLITNEGHHHMLYAMDTLLDKIYKESDSAKFSEVVKMIPEGFRVQIKAMNTKINKQLIDDKINPADLFYRSSGRSVYQSWDKM